MTLNSMDSHDRDIFNFMESYGFTGANYDPLSGKLTPTSCEFNTEGNVVFVKIGSERGIRIQPKSIRILGHLFLR